MYSRARLCLGQHIEMLCYLNERVHKSLATSEENLRNLFKTINEKQFLHPGNRWKTFQE